MLKYILLTVFRIYMLVCGILFFAKLEYWYREGNHADAPPVWSRFLVNVGAALFILHFLYIGINATVLWWWPITWGYYNPRNVSYVSYGTILAWFLSFILTVFLMNRVIKMYVFRWWLEKEKQEKTARQILETTEEVD